MVDAGPPEEHGLAVDPQSPLGIQAQGADAEGGRVGVEDLVAVPQGDPAGVEVGVVEAPPPRRGHLEPAADGELLAGEGRDRGLLAGDDLAVGVDHLHPHDGLGRRRPPIADRDGHGDRGHLVVDLGGQHLEPVGGQVHRAGLEQPHVTVDAAAGVPARVLVRDGLDLQLVLARLEQVVDGDEEAGVAVGVVGGPRPVHRHDGVAVDALELDDRGGGRAVLRDLDGAAVLPGAAREVAGGRSGLGGALRADDRVVGKGDRLPRRPHPDQLEVAVLLGPELPALVQGGATHGKTLAHRGC